MSAVVVRKDESLWNFEENKKHFYGFWVIYRPVCFALRDSLSVARGCCWHFMTAQVEPELSNAHFGVIYLVLKCWQITRAFMQAVENLLMGILSDRMESQSISEIQAHRFTKHQDSNGRKTKGYFPHILLDTLRKICDSPERPRLCSPAGG